MGLCLSKATSCSSSSWPDLPPDLAGLILSRLLSQMDRLSFGAVCRDWRLAAEHQRELLPPAMPWINLGRGFYHNLGADDNGRAWRRFATPKGHRAGASFGGWLMHEHKRSHGCFLRDPFSRVSPVIELPSIYYRYTRNVVTDPLTAWHSPSRVLVYSSHRLVALFYHCEGLFRIICFAPSSTETTEPTEISWSNEASHRHHGRDLVYKSIAFHHGRIFVVSSTENLFELDGESRVVIKERPVGATNYHNHHLVTSADKKKLLMVRWTIPRQTDGLKVDHRAMDLQVFEADLEKGEWSSEVKDLGNQILFVGRTGSRALVAAGSADQRFQGNRVFLLGYEWASSRCHAAGFQWIPDWEQCHNGTPSYCVYDMISGKASLVYLDECPSRVKYPKSSWFFPSS